MFCECRKTDLPPMAGTQEMGTHIRASDESTRESLWRSALLPLPEILAHDMLAEIALLLAAVAHRLQQSTDTEKSRIEAGIGDDDLARLRG